MSLENNTEIVKSRSVTLIRPFVIVILIATILVIGVGVFLTVQLNTNLSKVKALEELTVKNSRQLANLNEMLGRSLDANKEGEIVIPPINLKLSLEFFKHLNELLAEVDHLTFSNVSNQALPEKVTTPSVLPEPPKRTANAEVRWWKSLFNQFLIPLKGYFTELVHVQVIDAPVNELAMTTTSQTLMKKEFTLRLLTIRQLILNGLVPEGIVEMKEVRSLIAKNCNLNDDQVKKFLADLDQLIAELDKLKNGFQPNQPPLKAN